MDIQYAVLHNVSRSGEEFLETPNCLIHHGLYKSALLLSWLHFNTQLSVRLAVTPSTFVS
jgi:hypothetical protein